MGSDAPVTMPEPMEWIHKACNHPNEAQKVTFCGHKDVGPTMAHAIRRKRGQLEGRANPPIWSYFDKNPYDVPVDKIKDYTDKITSS